MAKRLDAGQVVVVPLAAVLTAGNVVTVTRDVSTGHLGSASSLLRVMGAVLVVAFYALVVFVYLRRDAACATSRSVTARAAAVVGGWLPLVFPYLPGARAGTLTLLVSNLLLVTGMSWSVVALHTLGRSFSVLPQARAVVCEGPYAVVRHPLYLGELLAAAGIVMRAPSTAGAVTWLLLLALQAYRVHHEERVLTQALPDYARYRSTTRWRIVPHLV